MFKDVIVQMAMEANAQGKPVNLCFGTVTGVDPVVIQITPNLIIKEEDEQVIVPVHCTDHKINITIEGPAGDGATPWEWDTEIASDPSAPNPLAFSPHSHHFSLNGKHTITIHEALKVNDIVMLGRIQGGQKYYIFDKVKGELP